jgi:hypothetical protein
MTIQFRIQWSGSTREEWPTVESPESPRNRGIAQKHFSCSLCNSLTHSRGVSNEPADSCVDDSTGVSTILHDERRDILGSFEDTRVTTNGDSRQSPCVHSVAQR